MEPAIWISCDNSDLQLFFRFGNVFKMKPKVFLDGSVWSFIPEDEQM